MGTRCILALLSLLFMLLAPATSFPARSSEQSHNNHVAVTAILRMLKDQILNRSRGTGFSGDTSSPRVKGHRQVPGHVNPLTLEVPEWNLEDDLLPELDDTNTADDSDRDLSGDVTVAISKLRDDNKRSRAKRPSDYGHGFFFGKRAPADTAETRHRDGSSDMPRDRRPDDYNWGGFFGKRGGSNAYGWGGFFGKRSGDVIEYDDFVA